ncbi:MAG: ribosome-binding factor A [Minisyncoccia bacterium]
MTFSTYNFRKEKLTSALEHLAAAFISKEGPLSPLITVTRSELSDSGRHITILVSVLPESEEKKAMDFLSDNKKGFSEYVQEHGQVMRMPSFDFKIDEGEKNRVAVENLI